MYSGDSVKRIGGDTGRDDGGFGERTAAMRRRHASSRSPRE